MYSPWKVSDLLSDRSSQTVLSDLLQWQNEVFDRILYLNPSLKPGIKEGFEVPMHMLPIKERISYMRRYRDIIGFDDLMHKLSKIDVGGTVPTQLVKAYGPGKAREIYNITGNLKQIKGLEADSPYYKIPSGYAPGGHTLDAVYSGMNISFDEIQRDIRAGYAFSENAASTSGHFGPGVNRIRTVSEGILNMPSKLKPGASFMSFDIETAGLMKNQISDISYRVGTVGQGGSIAGGTSGRLLFSPVAMRRGIVGGSTGKIRKGLEVRGAVPLGDFVQQAVGGPVSEDFAKAMVPFLEQMKKVDYILGYNQTGFDIPQVYSQLTQTLAYRSEAQDVIPGFRSLVDEAFSNLHTRAVDIHTLVSRSANLADIQVAPEFMRMNDARPFSIANILLETDLLERTGNTTLRDLIISSGLHDARVDELATSAILEHLDGLKPASLSDQALRTAIVSSSAITPFTKASSHLDVEDRALKHLIGSVDNGIRVPINGDTPQANKKLAELLRQASTGNKTAIEEAFNLIRSGATQGLSFDITPIEQQIYNSRKLSVFGNGVPNPESLLFRGDFYGNVAFKDGRKPNYRNVITGQRADISAAEFSSLQRELQTANLPFAGLSLEERRFASSISHLTTSIDPRASKDISHLIPHSLMSSFKTFDPYLAQYTTRSGLATLPASVLTQMGVLNQGDLLSLSVVDRTVKGGKSAVNLAYEFADDEQLEAFTKRLSTFKDASNEDIARLLGFNVEDEISAGSLDAVNKFRTALESDFIDVVSRTKKINIGQLYGNDALPVIEMLKEFNGVETLKDSEMIKMRLPFAGVRIADDASGIIQTAGAVLGKGLSGQEENIYKHVSAARQLQENLISFGANARNQRVLAASRAASEHGAAAATITEKAYNSYQSFRGKIPKAAGVALLAGIGIHFLNKRKENEPFNDTFQQMQIETYDRKNVADLLQLKIDSGVNLSYQKYDPLSTAYVVNDLNSNKIGHTSMSWDKDSNLYGGIL